MIETLRQLDFQLFQLINSDCANPLFDFICPILRYKSTWIPLYLLLALYLYQRLQKKIIWMIAFGAVTILLSDQTAAHIIKPLIHRLRPCNNPDLISEVRLVLAHCGNGFSFVSAHAANHFALAIYFNITFPKSKWNALFYVWATAISLSQVYVGIHFPADVFGGAMLGITIGAITGCWCNFVLQKNLFKNIFS